MFKYTVALALSLLASSCLSLPVPNPMPFPTPSGEGSNYHRGWSNPFPNNPNLALEADFNAPPPPFLAPAEREANANPNKEQAVRDLILDFYGINSSSVRTNHMRRVMNDNSIWSLKASDIAKNIKTEYDINCSRKQGGRSNN